MSAIRAIHIAKSYGDLQALRDVSVEIQAGELFGLVGPDGAGKTTFLRVLAGLLTPSGGEAWIGGMRVGESAAAVREQIGYMSQRFSLSENLTVLENLFYVAEVWGVKPGTRRQRITRLLEFSRLGPFQNRLTRNLSGGMKQKLSLAACLIHEPRILLLDEPTIGVDPLSRRDFWLILYDLLQDGSTILLSTPYMDEAERCRRVGFLLDGRLIACGSPGALKEELAIRIVVLRCPEPRAARRILGGIEGFEQTVLFGNRLHVAIQREGSDPAAMVERARSSGVRVERWAVREPSLEDVFLAYIRHGHEA